MRRGNVLGILILAFSLCWVLFLQDQTSVFDIGPTSNLPEMITADVAKDVDEPEHLKPADAIDPVVVMPLASIPIAPRALVNTNRLHKIYAPPVWRFNNLPTAPPQGRRKSTIVAFTLVPVDRA